MLTIRITLNNSDDSEVEIVESAHMALPNRTNPARFDEHGFDLIVKAACDRLKGAVRA